jgi:hypothetical protein
VRPVYQALYARRQVPPPLVRAPGDRSGRSSPAHVRGLNQALDEDGFQRVEAMDAEEHVSFQGRTIGSSGDVTACLTPKGNIAVVDQGQSRLHVYENYEILVAERGDADRAGEMVAAVARALGKKHDRELDI